MLNYSFLLLSLIWFDKSLKKRLGLFYTYLLSESARKLNTCTHANLIRELSNLFVNTRWAVVAFGDPFRRSHCMESFQKSILGIVFLWPGERPIHRSSNQEMESKPSCLWIDRLCLSISVPYGNQAKSKFGVSICACYRMNARRGWSIEKTKCNDLRAPFT